MILLDRHITLDGPNSQWPILECVIYILIAKRHELSCLHSRHRLLRNKVLLKKRPFSHNFFLFFHWNYCLFSVGITKPRLCSQKSPDTVKILQLAMLITCNLTLDNENLKPYDNLKGS